MVLFYILISLVVILLIFAIIYIFSKNKTLPDGTKLAQSNEFYVKHKEATISYLSAVYPTTDFKKMSANKVAVFYNSLWYYYNCEASYDRDFGDYYNSNKYNYQYNKSVKHCWEELPGCGKKWPKLPYTPQGYLYSFKSWLEDNWTPWIYSDSTIPPSEISAAYPGITLWTWFQGPAPIFMPQRVICRYTYDPSGPYQKSWENGYGQNFKYKIPTLTPGLTGDWKSYWNYPKKWWLGTPNNQYIEVTYSDIMNIGSGHWCGGMECLVRVSG